MVARKYPIISRNNYQYYDLDGISKIKIDSFAWDYGSKAEPVNNNLISYKRNYMKKKNYFDSQLEINFSFEDTDGYEDLSYTDITSLSFKLVPIPLSWDGMNVSEIVKHKNQNNLNYLLVQSSVRLLKYSNDLTIEEVSNIERAKINDQLKRKILIPKEYYLNPVIDRPDKEVLNSTTQSKTNQISDTINDDAQILVTPIQQTQKPQTHQQQLFQNPLPPHQPFQYPRPPHQPYTDNRQHQMFSRTPTRSFQTSLKHYNLDPIFENDIRKNSFKKPRFF
jgi:hypothetical protein